MVAGNISMPNPVLGVTDDMEGMFSVNFRIIVDRKSRKYVINDIQVQITNPYIREIYESKQANLIIKISCIPTYKTWAVVNPLEIVLDEREIDILLEVESFLVLENGIENYYDKSFSSIFSETTFSLSKGDIIALTGSKKIPIEKENEKASIGSIFKFSKIEESAEEQSLHFGFDNDQIYIYYSARDSEWDPVTMLFDQEHGLPYTALSLFVIPAITEAYRIITGADSDNYQEKRWFLVLDSLISKDDYSKDPFIIAQHVIRTGLPVSLAFKEILKMKNIHI